MYVIRDKLKYRAKVRTKSQVDKTGFTDGLPLNCLLHTIIAVSMIIGFFSIKDMTVKISWIWIGSLLTVFEIY